ncbi:MAG: hypothetical protein AB8B91_18885, partial [Rubripirellula sp.]
MSRVLVFAAALAFCSSVSRAHSPTDFLEVVSVEATNPIDHGVELKSRIDANRRLTPLVGPQCFARSVGGMGRTAKKQPAYLNWYKIVEPVKQATRTLDILDMVRGSSSKSLQVGSAEYFLSPAQRIKSGAPDPI